MKKLILLAQIVFATALHAQLAVPEGMQRIAWQPVGTPWLSNYNLAKPTILGAVTTVDCRSLFWGQTTGGSPIWGDVLARSAVTAIGYDARSGQELQLYKPGQPPGPEGWSFRAWNMSARFGIRGGGYSPGFETASGKVTAFTRVPLRLIVYGKTLEQFGVEACRVFTWSVYYPRRGDALMTASNYKQFLRRTGSGEVNLMLSDIAPPQSTFVPQNPEQSRGTFVVVEVTPYFYSVGEVLLTFEDLY